MRQTDTDRAVSVVRINTDEMKARTAARRLFREYLGLDREGQAEFDAIYAEVRAEVEREGGLAGLPVR